MDSQITTVKAVQSLIGGVTKAIVGVLITLMICTTAHAVQAVSITAAKNVITAKNVISEAILFTALYKDNSLVDIASYRGEDTITANFSTDMSSNLSNADEIRAFVWNSKSLEPLCSAFSSPIALLPDESPASTLIVYYSRSNNTKSLAETVYSVSGGDIARIEPVEPYPENYSECLAQVRKEQAEGYKPPITISLTSIEQYDTVLLGYPIWYNSLPSPVVTFLTSFDFTGKTIIPFCTSGSTGISSSVLTLKTLCPNSVVANGFRGTSASSVSEVTSLLSQNGFSK
ncbi:MAG: flavodoxin [Clostridia bacterium]|nr:flavodoxin [Clostridia bacterium]